MFLPSPSWSLRSKPTGGVQSALRSIHAPTRNEEGTYIRASIASDLDTLSTPSTPNHQVMMMDIFLLGGWVARPSAFYFVAFLCSPYLILFDLVALSFVVALLVSMLNLTARCSLCFSWSLSLLPAFSVDRVLLCLTEFNLTALCRLCLFLEYLAFQHRLALILH